MWAYLYSYVERYDLGEPSDDIQHVLKRIAVKLRKTQRVKAITGVGKKILNLQNFMKENSIYGVIIKIFDLSREHYCHCPRLHCSSL